MIGRAGEVQSRQESVREKADPLAAMMALGWSLRFMIRLEMAAISW